MTSQDSFGAKGTLEVGSASYEIYRLSAVAGDGLDVASLPFSLKVLLENLLRTEDGADITADDIRALAGWDETADPDKEILSAYGAYGTKKLYGKEVVGVIRSTFVVDEKGKIEVAQYNVKATGHVAKLRRDLGLG